MLIKATMVTALLMSFSIAALANDAVCTNPQVTSMRPTGDGHVEIVVKNNSATTSPKASVQLTYIDEDGKQTPGPNLAIASLKPHASVTLTALWPSNEETIHTKMACPGGASH